MIGIAEAVSVITFAEKSLTAHERTAFYKKDPWATTDKITVKILDTTDSGMIRYQVKGTDSGMIRYQVKGVDTRFNRLAYQEIKCISELKLKQLMEDYEE